MPTKVVVTSSSFSCLDAGSQDPSRIFQTSGPTETLHWEVLQPECLPCETQWDRLFQRPLLKKIFLLHSSENSWRCMLAPLHKHNLEKLRTLAHDKKAEISLAGVGATTTALLKSEALLCGLGESKVLAPPGQEGLSAALNALGNLDKDGQILIFGSENGKASQPEIIKILSTFSEQVIFPIYRLSALPNAVTSLLQILPLVLEPTVPLVFLVSAASTLRELHRLLPEISEPLRLRGCCSLQLTAQGASALKALRSLFPGTLANSSTVYVKLLKSN